MSSTPPAKPPALKDVSTHFAFGRNWASYSDIIDDARVAEAERGLVRLLGEDGLAGKSFFDLGCGSGVHAVAAARLGASRIVAIDLDPVAVATARAVLRRYAPQIAPEVRELSVFDLDPDTFGRFDVVYSWGVLHHTGALNEAVERATRTVAPGGRFAFALYHRTRMCAFWRWEKRWYAAASPRLQGAARALYVALLRLRFALTGGDFRAYVANYRSRRGMDFAHDVHDWMGGYPYESISAAEVEALMQRLGFTHLRSFVSPLTIGLFGSGCDEYVYRRAS
jgi:2-polyprenyl-6-hydroxyphenyl methylase/3-demethylubiquinone-9 3-methyltransferase